ncbi:MAG TPA: hypothetical protein VHG88_02815 [Burkholderiales bacterium]|nr:hypothetical protein [Burkholderiales bacterium]
MLWKKLWLLFTVIWGVVAALNVVTILVFGEEAERAKALTPLFFAVAVPAVLYGLGWAWARWRARK